MRHISYLSLIVALFASVAFAQTPVVDSLFHAAQSAYDEGRFENAELAALRGLREGAGLDELDLIKFHVILGFVYVARDQNSDAQREFVQILSVNPAYDLDPVLTSPKILDVFRQARADYMFRVASEPAIYRMPQADVRLAASWRSLALPGWGQFYKQQKVKGAALAAAQLFSLGALVFMQIEVNRRHDDYLDIRDYNNPAIEDRFNEYRRAWRVRNTVGYITLGVYAINYLDALYYPVFKRKP